MPPADDATPRDDGVLLLSSAAFRDIMAAILDRGEAVRFRAGGVSMLPFIRDGDVLTVSPLAGRRPGLGDVVAFRHPRDGHVLLHRVVGIIPAGVVTKGDAALQPDGLVPPDRVLGRLTLVERDQRRVRLGIGPERRLVAALSRHALLVHVTALGRKIQGGWRRLTT